jgi:hypothetical protein
VLVDQYSHLAIARQVSDSITPGISQIGFWPPLLHIVLIPVTLSDFLYFSGLAAPIVLVPLMALGAVFIYSIVYLLGNYRSFGVVAAAAFVLNPYILYYAVSAMTEVLFIVMMLGAVYFLLHWWETERLGSLMWVGIFIALAGLARFEGFMLIPAATAIVVYRLWATRRSLHEIEATVTMFLLVASIGVVSTFVYGYVYADNPLAFMSGEWSAYEQQQDYFLPTKGDALEALRYMMHASIHVLGVLPLALAAVSVVLVPLLGRDRWKLALAAFILMATPFVFDILALYQGSAIIYLPELPPFSGQYFNVRYALFAIGLVVVAPALLGAYLLRSSWYSAWTRMTGAAAAGVLIAVIVLQSIVVFASGACANCFELVTESRQSSPTAHARAGRVLAHEYDGGRILMTRALQNAVAVESGIPLKSFILEANEHYYDQVLGAPWLYARWVVMFNTHYDTPQTWFDRNELVSLIWGRSEDFDRFYELVYQNEHERIYRLRDDVVRAEIASLGLPVDQVPSLDNMVGPWNVKLAHEELWLPYQAATRSREGPDLVHRTD